MLVNEQSCLVRPTYSVKPIMLNGLVKFRELGGDRHLEMFNFKKWNDFLQTHEVTYPNFVRYFYSLSCTTENVLTSSVDGVEITIDKQLLSNLFNISNDGRSLYLNYYDGIHNLNLDKIAGYQSLWPSCHQKTS